jgi:hypothetical protein
MISYCMYIYIYIYIYIYVLSYGDAIVPLLI